MIWR